MMEAGTQIGIALKNGLNAVPKPANVQFAFEFKNRLNYIRIRLSLAQGMEEQPLLKRGEG
jgi:hypothetical protein